MQIELKFRPGECNDYINFNPLTPVLAVTNVGLCFTSDVITFGQNWHHLYSISAGEKDLCNDTQIRVIGSVKAELCMKMLRHLTEKLRAKLPVTTR